MAAAHELRDLILACYPDATFEIDYGSDPPGFHLISPVDVQDTDEVIELVMEREVAMQVDQELPVYLFPVRPPARVLAEAAER